MFRVTNFVMLMSIVAILAGCGNGSVDQMADREDADVATTPPSVTFTPENDGVATGKPGGPITISYRIIGKPIVGETVAIDLRIASTLEDQPFNVSFRNRSLPGWQSCRTLVRISARNRSS